MPLTETDYERLAYPELSALMQALDALDEGSFEAELAGDILSIEFSDTTKYVLNSHRAARQIWMAAERSAWHFDWEPEHKQWIAAKTGEELWSTLARVLSNRLAHSVRLARA